MQMTALQINKTVGNTFGLKWGLLTGLNKVNIFVGQNNSGKSLFLRYLLNEEKIKFLPKCKLSDLYFDEVPRIISILKTRMRDKIPHHEKADQALDFLEMSLITNSMLTNGEDYGMLVNKSKKYLQDTEFTSVLSSRLSMSESLLPIGAEQFRIDLKNKIDSIPPESNVFNFQKIYVPILRSLRSFSNDNDPSRDLFEARTYTDYHARFKKDRGEKIGDPNMPHDWRAFTGLSARKTIQNLLLGDLSQRKTVSEYEDFLSRSFYNNQSVTLIPRIDNDVLFVKIGQEKERPIYELGDGIQQIIIMTMAILKIEPDKSLLLFIDEPEINLHPGLQRRLLDVFIHDPFLNNSQIFLTTHSNHFLDMTFQFDGVTVFRISKTLPEDEGDEKTPNFSIIPISNPDLDLLADLGAHNSSVFLTNCTIWVEGITDRLYLRKFLDVTRSSSGNGTQFREDIHYSFVEYAGGNIVHWSEDLGSDDRTIDIKRLCGNAFIVADKDSRKEKRHDALKKIFGDRLFILPRREIENMLSTKVIEETVKQWKGIDVTIESNNDYKDEYLGRYLENIINTGNSKVRFATDSGTIKDKIKFATIAIEKINSPEDLTDDAKELCESILSFIESNNTD